MKLGARRPGQRATALLLGALRAELLHLGAALRLEALDERALLGRRLAQQLEDLLTELLGLLLARRRQREQRFDRVRGLPLGARAGLGRLGAVGEGERLQPGVLGRRDEQAGLALGRGRLADANQLLRGQLVQKVLQVKVWHLAAQGPTHDTLETPRVRRQVEGHIEQAAEQPPLDFLDVGGRAAVGLRVLLSSGRVRLR
uniref:Putative secreted protein n=1 Tax=Ixodes ricinus TaxID=34613 RepID=A0A6B0V1Z5_IXORI